MPTMEDIESWRSHGARGSDGDTLGKIEDVYLDRETGKLEWMPVTTGFVRRNVCRLSQQWRRRT
jgi:uncharacterized protein YrrD